MREVPHGQDGNFSHDHAISRINSDLANGIGNLSQRTLSMIYKNCEEKIPQPSSFTDEDRELLDAAYKNLLPAILKDLETFAIHRALEKVMKLASDADSYVDKMAPWKLKKEDPARMNTVLYVLAEVIRCLAIAMQPVTPDASAAILAQLCVPENERDFSAISDEHAIKAGTRIEKPEGVFPRILTETAA
jgi:methionyl-tRNA synthetase